MSYLIYGVAQELTCLTLYHQISEVHLCVMQCVVSVRWKDAAQDKIHWEEATGGFGPAGICSPAAVAAGAGTEQQQLGSSSW